MLCSKFLGGAALCRLAGRIPASWAALHQYCADPSSVTPHPRDYSLPNPSWTTTTRQLYDQYLRDSVTWRRVPSYSSNSHYSTGDLIEPQGRRSFPRMLDEEGAGFEYCMFYNKAQKRMVSIFQPGPHLEGYPGYTHGGVIVTMIDVTVGKLAMHACGRVVTANLNIDFRSPVLLGSTVLVDGRVDKIESPRIYTSCRIRSHDDAVLHAEATGLFIKVDSGKDPSE